MAFNGRRAHAFDDRDLLAAQFDQDRHLAAEGEVRELDDGGREHGRHARVHGVAAALQEAHPGLDRERVPARHHAAPPAHDRAERVRRTYRERRLHQRGEHDGRERFETSKHEQHGVCILRVRGEVQVLCDDEPARVQRKRASILFVFVVPASIYIGA